MLYIQLKKNCHRILLMENEVMDLDKSYTQMSDYEKLIVGGSVNK